MINGINLFNTAPLQFKGGRNVSFKGSGVQNDCFIKSEQKKPLDNEFIKWAEENDFLNKGLKESFSEENLLGQGFSNSVYKIEGNDDYVLRVPRSYFDPDKTDFGDYKIKDTKDKSLKSNFGQQAALIQSDDVHKPSIEVLLKQQGITNGNPPPSAIFEESGKLREGEISYESIERKEHYAKCLKILASMPQSAYDDLIDKFIELDEAGYKFDYYNPNNFLLDEDKGSIEIIDLDKYKAPYKNDLGNALWALRNIEYLDTYLSSYDESSHLISDNDKNEAVGNTIEVISKYTKALQNKGKKYSSDGYEFMTQLFESYPMSFYLKTLNRSEKLQKLKDMGVMD